MPGLAGGAGSLYHMVFVGVLLHDMDDDSDKMIEMHSRFQEMYFDQIMEYSLMSLLFNKIGFKMSSTPPCPPLFSICSA